MSQTWDPNLNRNAKQEVLAVIMVTKPAGHLVNNTKYLLLVVGLRNSESDLYGRRDCGYRVDADTGQVLIQLTAHCGRLTAGSIKMF